MANTSRKYKSLNIGSIVKNKDKSKPDYISVRKGYTLLVKDDKGETYTLGQYINLENKKTLLESAERLEENGNDNVAARLRERAERLPEFVRFELQAKVE